MGMDGERTSHAVPHITTWPSALGTDLHLDENSRHAFPDREGRGRSSGRYAEARIPQPGRSRQTTPKEGPRRRRYELSICAGMGRSYVLWSRSPRPGRTTLFTVCQLAGTRLHPKQRKPCSNPSVHHTRRSLSYRLSPRYALSVRYIRIARTTKRDASHQTADPPTIVGPPRVVPRLRASVPPVSSR